jgi:glucose/arabinose dehydrogenase
MTHSVPRLALIATLAVALTLPPSRVTAAQSTQLTTSGTNPQVVIPPGPTRTNNNCPTEVVFYDPGHAEDIVVPRGYKVEVFAKDLSFPTSVAFLGDKEHFQVFVIESGLGLPSRCNDHTAYGGARNPNDPFTPEVKTFDRNGNLVRSGIGKQGFQTEGPAIGLAFERESHGGTLFASDSNQGLRRPGGGNNSSRIVVVDPEKNTVTGLISGLPTGDHPAEQITVRDGFIYWSQGSATNAAVVGHDNGGGTNQHDVPCQDVVLSRNVFDSGDGHMTSGFSDHAVARPGATVHAFEGATHSGMCSGAILRANLHAKNIMDAIEPFSWGYRNPFGIRFAPNDHPLKGNLLVTENGEDERGARPTNNAPDRLQVARQNADGTPDFHGWPDRFGFLDSTQAVFNPQGGPGDDLCNPTPGMPGNATTFPACKPVVQQADSPVRHVLEFPPQPIAAPIGLEPADVAAVGLDFAPDSFVTGVVRRGAALISREGDFGFSAANGEPEEGHDIQLANFVPAGKHSGDSGKAEPFVLELMRFAFNCRRSEQAYDPAGRPVCNGESEQAFVLGLHGINRPVDAKFGPDGALYLVDYGAVRDFGQSDPDSKFITPGDGPLVQIPGTGVIWKITPIRD